MKPLKGLIVEDNLFMAAALQDMLLDHSKEIDIVGKANTGKQALQLIDEANPDVIFLDIELPDMTGFELLSQVSKFSFKTIFTTSHSQYAIKAFRFNALDYLVKPIKKSELKEAINRCLKSDGNNKGIRNALENLETTNIEELKLLLPTKQMLQTIYLKHITHIEGERNYSYIHRLTGKKELSSKNLAYFDKILEDKGFFRCHRSFIVNRYHIEYLKNDAFVLRNHLNIPISRRKKMLSKEWFGRNEF